MHKIKKGIKKKIKGKKDKNEEIFTEEEFERYKKQKEDEKRQEEDPIKEEPCHSYTEEPNTAEQTREDHITVETKEEQSDEEGENKEDWRNFLVSADIVVKKTSENLEHIKEASYFQAIQVNHSKDEADSEVNNQIRSVTPELTKNWTNLEEGGFSDDEDVTPPVEVPVEPVKALHERVRDLKEIVPIQNIPSVDTEDYAGIFDTTYVDQIESGEIKLHIIPQSPTEYDPSEPDPFDTSGIEKILQKAKPKGKKKDKKDSKKKLVKEIKVVETVAPVIKKKIVVNLGSAVHALTSENQTESPIQKVNTSRSSRIVPEINLLGGEDTGENQNQANENCLDIQGEQPLEKSEIDNILSSNNNNEDLPSPDCPSNNQLLNELQTDLNKTDKETDNNKDNSLKNIVDEFDVISEEINCGCNSNLELITQSSEKSKELDEEFSVLAEESLSKDKEITLSPIEDDPFDTSVAEKFIEKVPSIEEVTDLSKLDKEVKSDDLLSTENIESDPFDTSTVNDIITADPFDTLENKDLPETLVPQCQTDDKEEDNFDPFDTSAVGSFGKIELKFLEAELLNDLDNKEEDFDFNPREEENQTSEKLFEEPDCFLSTSDEILAEPVLSPQTFSVTEEDIDPFDTTIADKIQIKDLEKELLENDNNTNISPSNLNSSDSFISNTLVFPPSHSLTATINSEIDPFDTSVADSICEKVRLETEEKTNQIKDSLTLKLKPPRPPSPACLLATTPLDENPTLLPTSKSPTTTAQTDLEAEFDPFDTSIAAQFGKKELQVLESELLTENNLKIEEDNFNFNPREEEENIDNKPITERPSPTCLLSSVEQVEQPLPPLAPAKFTSFEDNTELDPFDTSVADKLGTSELTYFESKGETESKITANFKLPSLTKVTTPKTPTSAIPASCIFAVTPTDNNPPLQPSLEIREPKVADTPEDIDPFDTSIADQFGKTELKALEEILFTSGTNEPSISQHIAQEKNFILNTENISNIITHPTSQDCQPVLQPTSIIDNKEYFEEVDPFDTSIADNFSNTELRALEIELLADAGVKRNLSDEEGFDPCEEKKSPRIVL